MPIVLSLGDDLPSLLCPFMRAVYSFDLVLAGLLAPRGSGRNLGHGLRNTPLHPDRRPIPKQAHMVNVGHLTKSFESSIQVTAVLSAVQHCDLDSHTNLHFGRQGRTFSMILTLGLLREEVLKLGEMLEQVPTLRVPPLIARSFVCDLLTSTTLALNESSSEKRTSSTDQSGQQGEEARFHTVHHVT